MKDMKKKDDKETEKTAKPEDLKTVETADQPKSLSFGSILRYAARLLLWATLVFAIFSLVIYFTPLRFKSRINPIGSTIYKFKSMAANTDVERAHLHISESERLTGELKKIKTSAEIDVTEISYFYTMLDHNDQAVQYMLSAEKSGADLKQEGLIKRLCDSLGEQYALRHNLKVSDILEDDKLVNRVSKGEELKTVFEEIQNQLKEAMHW